MDRRQYLQSFVAASALTISGCQTPTDNAPNGTPPVEQPTERSVTVTNYKFTEIQSDAAPNKTELVVQGEHEYRISGTTTVKNGCMNLVVQNEPAMADSNPLTVALTIGTKHSGGVCTQAIETKGFALTFTTDTTIDETQLTFDTFETDTLTLTPRSN